MAEHERSIPNPEVESTPELIQSALTKLGEFYGTAARIRTPNAALVLKTCVAQIALLEQDLRTRMNGNNAAGEDYSGNDEAIKLLKEVVRDLKHSRSDEVYNAIADLDPEHG